MIDSYSILEFLTFVKCIHPSLGINVCNHWASLVIPNGDPLDGFLYPILTLMKDSYSVFGNFDFCKIYKCIVEDQILICQPIRQY